MIFAGRGYAMLDDFVVFPLNPREHCVANGITSAAGEEDLINGVPAIFEFQDAADDEAVARILLFDTKTVEELYLVRHFMSLMNWLYLR
jgi:hypothetical protein